jgi:LssY C-terminus
LSIICLRKIPAYLLLLMFLLPDASTQEMSAVPATLTIPDGTPIKLQLAENVSSTHARVEDSLDFVVVRDVNVGGFTVIPAGTEARGSVTQVRGRRCLGIGGSVSLKLDSLELANGERVGLRADMRVKGRSRTRLMALGMAATALIFLPATPVFLLTRGHASTVLKSTEITAQIQGATPVLSAGLPRSRERSSELSAMMDYLPPRVFNGEGREGDMVNLVFVAQQRDLQDAFKRAGWVQTDKWKPIFVWHLLRHGINDTLLPMARFYLFGRVQDYSYALPDPNAVMSRRHHLRIWKTGYAMDGTPIWAGAASHDVAIEIAKGGHVINHRIDPAVDAERDFVGTDLTDNLSVSRKEYLQSADPVFLAQTASGDPYHSDSRILLLDFHPATAPKVDAASRPSSIAKEALLPKAASADFSESDLTSPF